MRTDYTKSAHKEAHSEAGRIAFPISAYRRGSAFEYLILSYYNLFSAVKVEEWSSCVYGKSGKLYQCDGILHDGSKRYLFEAKFFQDRAASIRDMHPERREAAATDLDCDGILCISLNGFDDSVREWQRQSSLEIILLGWEDLRIHILSRISEFSTVLLDNISIFDRLAISASGSKLHFTETPPCKPLDNFPEFVCFPDSLEIWLRRLPKLAHYQQQLASGYFCYLTEEANIQFVADRESDLSLFDTWQIEDTFIGYSARTYNAMKATAQAVYECNDSDITVSQNYLRRLGWNTGEKGVRKALDDLIILGFVSKRSEGIKVKYSLTPLGYTYVVVGSKSADEIFFGQLQKWPPYRFTRDAILSGKVHPKRDALIEYFKAQYRPYEPYARCIFNQNTTDGVLALFKKFG
ncbi:hypothetical protein FJZ31_35955 [Candidatus Poribacteria bacterium]|nr:hypothetical protein [Candidatus Poribacteria bacterium]